MERDLLSACNRPSVALLPGCCEAPPGSVRPDGKPETPAHHLPAGGEPTTQPEVRRNSALPIRHYTSVHILHKESAAE